MPGLFFLSSAVLGFFSALAGLFLKEDYMRFREGKALANALAGELKSIREPILVFQDNLKKHPKNINLVPEAWPSVEWPIPSSPLFDANVSKIGLLDIKDAGEVAYVYENIRAFRQAFHICMKYPGLRKDMSHICWGIIRQSGERGGLLDSLIGSLEQYAQKPYWQHSRFWFVTCLFLLVVIAVEWAVFLAS